MLRIIRKSDILAKVSFINLLLAVIGVGLAFFSGYQASDLADQTFKIDDAIIAQHHLFGRLLLFISPVCLALRFASDRALHNRAVFHWLYLLSLIVCVALVIGTGYLGGELVFKHGAGVSARVGARQ